MITPKTRRKGNEGGEEGRRDVRRGGGGVKLPVSFLSIITYIQPLHTYNLILYTVLIQSYLYKLVGSCAKITNKIKC